MNTLENKSIDSYGRKYTYGYTYELGTRYRLGSLTTSYGGYRIGVNSEHVVMLSKMQLYIE
jgi:hypothetical protein